MEVKTIIEEWKVIEDEYINHNRHHICMAYPDCMNNWMQCCYPDDYEEYHIAKYEGNE